MVGGCRFFASCLEDDDGGGSGDDGHGGDSPAPGAGGAGGQQQVEPAVLEAQDGVQSMLESQQQDVDGGGVQAAESQASASTDLATTTPKKARPADAMSPASSQQSPGASGSQQPLFKRGRSNSSLGAVVGQTGGGGKSPSIAPSIAGTEDGGRARVPSHWLQELCVDAIWLGKPLKRELQWAEACRSKWVSKDATEAIPGMFL